MSRHWALRRLAAAAVAALLVALFCASCASRRAGAAGSAAPEPVPPAPTATQPAKPNEPTDAVGSFDHPEQDASPGPGWLGVELATTDGSQAGVLVRAIIPGSPAEQAGIIPGDVILRIDGEAMQMPQDVVQVIGSRPSGERVSLALKRGDRDRLLAVRLARRPDDDEVQRMRYVGEPAPRFESLKTVQGAISSSLGSLRGQVVVVEFWSPWCIVCRLLIPTMNAWHQRYSAQGVEVVGITTESVVRAAQAATQLGIIHPVLSDQTGKTTRAYRAVGLPTVFVIDRAGTVRDVMVGYSSERLRELEALIERL